MDSLFDMVASGRLSASDAADIMMLEKDLNRPFIIYLYDLLFGKGY